jgi:hypothetical protein
LNDDDKHKAKDKRRWSMKKDHGQGRKARSQQKMKKSTDVESDSEDTSSSSSDEEEEGGKTKKKKTLSTKFNSLCVMSLSSKDSFNNMTCNSSSKRSRKDASDSDFEDEVCDELSSLLKENEELVDLLDNRYHMLIEAKNLRKELRASLEEAREKVAELVSKNL